MEIPRAAVRERLWATLRSPSQASLPVSRVRKQPAASSAPQPISTMVAVAATLLTIPGAVVALLAGALLLLGALPRDGDGRWLFLSGLLVVSVLFFSLVGLAAGLADAVPRRDFRGLSALCAAINGAAAALLALLGVLLIYLR